MPGRTTLEVRKHDDGLMYLTIRRTQAVPRGVIIGAVLRGPDLTIAWRAGTGQWNVQTPKGDVIWPNS